MRSLSDMEDGVKLHPENGNRIHRILSDAVLIGRSYGGHEPILRNPLLFANFWHIATGESAYGVSICHEKLAVTHYKIILITAKRQSLGR